MNSRVLKAEKASAMKPVEANMNHFTSWLNPYKGGRMR